MPCTAKDLELSQNGTAVQWPRLWDGKVGTHYPYQLTRSRTWLWRIAARWKFQPWLSSIALILARVHGLSGNAHYEYRALAMLEQLNLSEVVMWWDCWMRGRVAMLGQDRTDRQARLEAARRTRRLTPDREKDVH